MNILIILLQEDWIDRQHAFLLRQVSWDLRLYFRLDLLCPGTVFFESARRKIWQYNKTIFKTRDGLLHGKQRTITNYSEGWGFSKHKEKVWTIFYTVEEQIWRNGKILDDNESLYKNGKRHFGGQEHSCDRRVAFGKKAEPKYYRWIYCKDRVVAYKQYSINYKGGTDSKTLRRKEPKRRNTKAGRIVIKE